MNREVKTIFGDVYNAFSRYQASVAATLSRYECDMETAKREAASFVPEITAFVPQKDDTGETISPEQQHAEAVQEANAQAVVKDTSAEDWARKRARERVAAPSQNMEKYTL